MTTVNAPRHLKNIEYKLHEKLKLVIPPCSELFETQQLYHDEILEIYQEAFRNLIENTLTYSGILSETKKAYENALEIRDKRISQYITQDKVFGISVRKKQRDDKIKNLLKETEDLKEQNLKLTFEISKLKKNMGKMKLKELDGSSYPVDDAYGDPVVLRIALDRCREQLATTQKELRNKTDEYAETVPRREYDILEAKHCEISKNLDALKTELKAIQDGQKRLLAQKKSIDEELFECKERCRELERAGTPRPQWEICADFIGGGRDRWWQLASGLSSRDILRVLLKELGPAAESENLEHFDGLGTDPAIPPYLRYVGTVRNLRLSRREICVVINDIWLGKADHRDMTMQDYVTKYFEDRYQQPSMRAEWAYNMCAGAEQMLDEPQVKLFWGVLHGHLSEHIYWGLKEFEKTAKTLFPLKSDVDIKNLSDVRQLAQDKYMREIVSELGGKHAANKPATVDNVKRAIALVDPAIDHIRMERYIRWAFSDPTSELSSISALPLKRIAARLAAGDIERVDRDTVSPQVLEQQFSKKYKLLAETSVSLNKSYITKLHGTKSLKLAVSLSDNSIEVYELDNTALKKICRLSGHKKELTEVVFCPKEDHLLYSTGYDGVIKLWDTRRGGSCVQEYKGDILVVEDDAYLVFWDQRNTQPLGGYWNSHTEDITQVTNMNAWTCRATDACCALAVRSWKTTHTSCSGTSATLNHWAAIGTRTLRISHR
ncbi:putative translin-associated factor X interacting protein 1 isoform 4 [Operophtera brumata]|uniref:Putative translin-associated factor X interacting protein 1 isoform 4 n=1 Tax=Operophtera brumata TaxID=104452 RepID=A0A0L7LV52_OPEBR|nr:putative translin-associated factor X interacting protein 1 isoform 4 [Operophtera brumata]